MLAWNNKENITMKKKKYKIVFLLATGIILNSKIQINVTGKRRSFVRIIIPASSYETLD